MVEGVWMEGMVDGNSSASLNNLIIPPTMNLRNQGAISELNHALTNSEVIAETISYSFSFSLNQPTQLNIFLFVLLNVNIRGLHVHASIPDITWPILNFKFTFFTPRFYKRTSFIECLNFLKHNVYNCWTDIKSDFLNLFCLKIFSGTPDSSYYMAAAAQSVLSWSFSNPAGFNNKRKDITYLIKKSNNYTCMGSPKYVRITYLMYLLSTYFGELNCS